MQSFHLDPSNAEEFLEVYKTVVPEYHLMLHVILTTLTVQQLTAGPIIALEITGGENVVQNFREFSGPV